MLCQEREPAVTILRLSCPFVRHSGLMNMVGFCARFSSSETALVSLSIKRCVAEGHRQTLETPMSQNPMVPLPVDAETSPVAMVKFRLAILPNQCSTEEER